MAAATSAGGGPGPDPPRGMGNDIRPDAAESRHRRGHRTGQTVFHGAKPVIRERGSRCRPPRAAAAGWFDNMSFFSKTFDRINRGLKKTRDVLFTDVRTLFVPGRQIDESFLDEL